MRKLITAKTAGRIVLFFMYSLIFFHVCVLLGWIPEEIIWGGRMEKNSGNLVRMELISIAVTILFISIITAKIRNSKRKKLVTYGVWIIFAYMLLNTLGNFTSEHFFENSVLAPLTLIMSFFIFRLAIEK
jgi:cyanate permease